MKVTPLTDAPFTVPVICSTNPKGWFVYFEFFHAGKWHSIKKREGINRIHNPKEKKINVEALRKAGEEWLKMGWNPLTDPDFKLRNILHPQQQGK